MKKLAAILLIAILFFNWYGYRIVTSLVADQADKQLELRLDKSEYNESELIEVRVPLNVPYQNNQSEFERHYGEMEVNGQHYTYVKRKIENGFLVLKCIPNESREKIEAAGNNYFKMTNGLDQEQPGKKQANANFAKSFWSEYDGRETEFSIDIYSQLIRKLFLDNNVSLYNTCQLTPTQPPEAAVAIS